MTGGSPVDEAFRPSAVTVLAVATLTLLALTEQFSVLPGAVAAFASARYILRPPA